jgi:hypothetical protein
MPATLRIRRKFAFIGQNHPYEVVLDGQPVGTVGFEQAVEVEIETGPHKLQIRAGTRLRSPERSFEAAAGQVVRYWCRTRLLWPELIAAQLKPDLWVVLKPD